MRLKEYFDRIAIVHLPERRRCLDSLLSELRTLGIERGETRLQTVEVPPTHDWTGWPSRAVCINFLGHLGALRQAMHDGVQTVWVLEDDAIFSKRMRRDQQALTGGLARREWGLCFLGHSWTGELPEQPSGFARPSSDFTGAHCYAVHARVLPRLVEYLEQAVVLPRHHPQGARLYIDAAFTLFRQLNPDVTTWVHHPTLSVRSRRFSRLTDAGSPGEIQGGAGLLALAQNLRDRWWKLSA